MYSVFQEVKNNTNPMSRKNIFPLDYGLNPTYLIDIRIWFVCDILRTA